MPVLMGQGFRSSVLRRESELVWLAPRVAVSFPAILVFDALGFRFFLILLGEQIGFIAAATRGG